MRRAAAVLSIAGAAALLAGCGSEAAGDAAPAPPPPSTAAAAPSNLTSSERAFVTAFTRAGYTHPGGDAEIARMGEMICLDIRHGAPTVDLREILTSPAGLTADQADDVYELANRNMCVDAVRAEEQPSATAAAPAPAPAPVAPPAPVEPQMTISQENALESAESYLSYTAFSRSGLIKQLEYEGFSTADAEFAVDTVTVDWMEQAALSAKSYMDYSSFSRSGLIKQLEYEGFTSDQAEHGANSAGL
jgi:hypothetical protein